MSLIIKNTNAHLNVFIINGNSKFGDLEISNELEPKILKMLDENPRDFQRQDNPYVMLRDIYENNGDYNKLVELFSRLQKELPDYQNVKNLVQKYQEMADAKASKSMLKDSSNNKK